jgi:ABC-2 type transport system permease protein
MFASGNMTLANFYPITASLGLIGYRAYDAAVNWNIIHCLCSIVAVIVISAVLVMLSKNVEPKKTVKKSKKVKTKKGW